MAMTSRERVAAALARRQPDRVPYVELWIDRTMANRLMGWQGAEQEPPYSATQNFTPDGARAIAERLHLDSVYYVLRPPVYADTGRGADGRQFVADGRIKSLADVALIDLPDPRDDALYAEAAALAEGSGDLSAWFVTRSGIFPTVHGMGFGTFCMALYEDRPLVETVLDRYTDWACAVASRAAQLGFDVFATADDVAFKTGPFFAPALFREIVVPRLQRLAACVPLPWVVHSDGDTGPLLDDFAAVGVAGVHPIEKAAMDIREAKRAHGHHLCLLGNVDLDLLARGSPEDVDREVRGLIRDVAPGGGYIASSGNSLASYLRPENVLAMAQAIQRYGAYPIGAAGPGSGLD